MRKSENFMRKYAEIFGHMRSTYCPPETMQICVSEKIMFFYLTAVREKGTKTASPKAKQTTVEKKDAIKYDVFQF